MSVYFNTLTGKLKARYLQKIKFIDNIDPYDCMETTFCREVKLFPNVAHSDISNYFIHTTNTYTAKEFKAFKTIDSYKFNKCGYVQDILVRKFAENVLVLGKVRHPQRITEPILQPWFVAKEDGEILCGHCTCIAGLDASCSHLGAVMYAVEDAKTHEEETSVTDVKAYWKEPTEQEVEVTPLNAVLTKYMKVKPPTKIYPESTPESRMAFLREIKNEVGIISPAMMVTAPFCYEIAAEQMNPLTRLYEDEYISLTLEELRSKASNVRIKVTSETCKKLEEMTRKQSASKLWSAHRAGRITGPKFKNACCTSIKKPGINMIKAICYPYDIKFNCEHKKDALEAYKTTASETHQNFVIRSTGFMLSPSYPQFCASPDAIISCDCCGHGCVEIKCPFCAKDFSVAEVLPTYIAKGTNELKLKENHEYFYEIQMQMAICDKMFCDFVVWTTKDLYIERIPFNDEFWQAESSKATEFWSHVIVPELLGKYYTRPRSII